MEERELSSKTGLKYAIRFSLDLKVFDYLYRDQCENYKWCKKIIYHWRDHGKSLCTIWFFYNSLQVLVGRKPKQRECSRMHDIYQNFDEFYH